MHLQEVNVNVHKVLFYIMTTRKRKHVCVSLQQKLDVLQRLDHEESIAKLAIVGSRGDNNQR